MTFSYTRRKWQAAAAVVAVVIASVFISQWINRPKTPVLPEPPLRVLAARHGIEVGNYASLRRLHDKPYTDILNSQFDFETIDGELNWAFNDGTVRPSPTTYDYTNPDKVFSYIKAHGKPIQAHHLVWGEEKWLPTWLKDGNYTKAQLLDLIHQHINNVAGHYKGQIREWTVVNEPFSRSQHVYGLHDWWADHTGNDNLYIDQSFIWARQADPHAKLILSDFGNDGAGPIADAMYTYTKDALARGIPIDGIGMQMHIDGQGPPTMQAVTANMQRFGALGIGVYVTELDVNMTSVTGTEDYRMQKEATIYHDMARACIESKVCHSFNMLGLTDKESWYVELGLKTSEPLTFDKRYNPKPAWYALYDAFKQP
jgi:endo-1,4-beta-xylanase